MSVPMIPLLLHSDDVPRAAREALRTAQEAPPERRVSALKAAARALRNQTDLDCADALVLVGLPEDTGCL